MRQNAHTLHGQICAASGKRIAKHMSSVIGPWLAGIHDGDRSVMKSAQDALVLVFPTAEKRSSLSRAYHGPILEFCSDAVLKETPQSLSDERNTTPEDSEAKYARLVASSISVITNLFGNLPDNEREKQSSLYESLLGSQKLWDFSCAEDSMVRRALLRLLQLCLKKHEGMSEQTSSRNDHPDQRVNDIRSIGTTSWCNKWCYIIKEEYWSPDGFFIGILRNALRVE